MQVCASRTVYTALCLTTFFAATVHRAAAEESAAPAKVTADWYFWNEITGETQWEDPGDVPFEEDGAVRYWLSPTGERLDYDPNAHKYSWVENWSEEHKRPFYYNQKTKESTWEKPVDLAWRRVRNKTEL